MDIEFMYLDLVECTRSLGAEINLETAVLEVSRALAERRSAEHLCPRAVKDARASPRHPGGQSGDFQPHLREAIDVEVVVHKVHVQSEEQARALGFESSPTIRINGRDIQLEVRESRCEPCSALCGESVDCRVWVYQGTEYTAPPEAMIVEAILREAYTGSPKGVERRVQTDDVPENIRRFFAATSRSGVFVSQGRDTSLSVGDTRRRLAQRASPSEIPAEGLRSAPVPRRCPTGCGILAERPALSPRMPGTGASISDRTGGNRVRHHGGRGIGCGYCCSTLDRRCDRSRV